MEERIPLLSIIVPAYNAEAYIDECLDSLLRQTLRDIEVIVVDDGSTDATLAILKKHAEADHRLRIVHTDNGGPARARLTALQQARAELIGFVDADDKIDPDMYQRLTQAMQQHHADMAICTFYKWYRNTCHPYRYTFSDTLIDHDTLMRHVLHNSIQSYLCNKLFRKSLIPLNGTTARFYEDNAQFYMYAEKCRHAVVIHQPLYYYRQRQSSTTKKVDNVQALSYFYESEKQKYRYYLNHNLTTLSDPHLLQQALRTAKRIARGSSPRSRKLALLRTMKADISALPHIDTHALSAKSRLRLFLWRHAPNLFITAERILHQPFRLYKSCTCKMFA